MFKSNIWGSKFLMVEANEEMKNILDKTGFNYVICALSDDVKEANYFKLPGNAGNGLYVEKNSVNSKITKVKTETLNSLLDTNYTYNIIKLDVQGSELDILGRNDFFKKADFVLTECSLVEYNVGAHFLWSIKFFWKNNYKFFDIIDLLYDKKGQLIQIDVLFKNNLFNLTDYNKNKFNQ